MNKQPLRGMGQLKPISSEDAFGIVLSCFMYIENLSAEEVVPMKKAIDFFRAHVRNETAGKLMDELADALVLRAHALFWITAQREMSDEESRESDATWDAIQGTFGEECYKKRIADNAALLLGEFLSKEREKK